MTTRQQRIKNRENFKCQSPCLQHFGAKSIINGGKKKTLVNVKTFLGIK